MEDKIIVLDGSERFHIDNTLQVLGEVERIREVPQKIWKSFDKNFLQDYVRAGFDAQRNQLDIYRFMDRLSQNSWIHQENADALKVIVLDEDLFDSRENINFGFGVNLPYTNLNKYVIVSTARLKNEMHGRHVMRHELGHAFGAPALARAGVYNSLGAHCPDRTCTMHQELSGASSYDQALRVLNSGVPYCGDCSEDIRRHTRQ